MNTLYDVTTIENRSTLWVDSNRIDDCLNYFFEKKIDILGINPVRGYALDNVDFLKNYPEICGLLIVPSVKFKFDLSPVLSLVNLRDLTLNEVSSLSLATFRHLTHFRGMWHEDLMLEKCASLKSLSLNDYKAKSGDLNEFPVLPSLVELSLTQGPLKSVDGISKMKSLRHLELAYFSKLESLSDVTELPALEFLWVSKCKKLKEHAVVSKLKKLHVLRFNDCGSIPNLQFINEMPELEEFRFVDTLVVDGDLSPLLRLKRVGFLPKKGYSHSPKDFVSVDS
jgi:hypothetical protein